MQGKAAKYRQDDPEAWFNAEQSALVVKNAEAFYRTLSWNVREQHMADTVDRLMRHHGPGAKGIIWAHNTHVANSRAADVGNRELMTLGQLVRERHGSDDVVLVGFGSHRGTVIAATHWGGQSQVMAVPPAQKGSYEDAFHTASPKNQMVIFSDAKDSGPLSEARGHRAIGVLFDPAHERDGVYVSTVLSRRYDAFLFIDQTRALRPLHPEPRREGKVGTRLVGV